MTYIEFFDRTSVENLCACLCNVPERVIFLGEDAEQMQKRIANYKKIFLDRGYRIEFIVETVAKDNLSQAIRVLNRLVDTYPDCAFGITGGDELLLMALGCVYAQRKDRKLQIHRINVKNNAVYDCDADGVTISKETPLLSVCDNIRLYGGDVVYGSREIKGTQRWDMNPEFIADINTMWQICREHVRQWNYRVGILEEIDGISTHSLDGLTSMAAADVLNRRMASSRLKEKTIRKFLVDLSASGLLVDWHWNEAGLQITHKNHQVKRCLTTSGLALEMKTFSLIRGLKEKDGTPVYDDALNGVSIEWEDPSPNTSTPNTTNEVDVMAMRDMIPVFISCKNGQVKTEELYKLNTVASRFGGPYAKKVLIATALDSLGAGAARFRLRAESMNIQIIENVQLLSDKQFGKKLRNLWKD